MSRSLYSKLRIETTAGTKEERLSYDSLIEQIKSVPEEYIEEISHFVSRIQKRTAELPPKREFSIVDSMIGVAPNLSGDYKRLIEKSVEEREL